MSRKKKVTSDEIEEFARYYQVALANQMLTPGGFLTATKARSKPPVIKPATLKALKTATPYRPTRRMPDYTQVLTGWRGWNVSEDKGSWRLQALGQVTMWEPRRIMIAQCRNGGRFPFGSLLTGATLSESSRHPAPAWNCQCGIWAFKDVDRAVAAIGSQYDSVKVIGSVSLWGKVIETENGYRAQYAYPSELWLLDESLEELGLIYDVPVRRLEPK